MTQHKGFSLLEVLISLILVTALALSLIGQQGRNVQLLAQMELQSKATQFLDQIEESLFIGADKLPALPAPYIFAIQRNKQSINLQVSWFNHLGTLARKRNFIKEL